MNTRHSLTTISKFRLDDPSKVQEVQSFVQEKRSKNSYFQLKTLKENYNSHEKSPLSAHFIQKPIDKEKENLSPFNKSSSSIQNLNKSLNQIVIKSPNKPKKLEKKEKSNKRSKSFIASNKNGFKVFQKPIKSKSENLENQDFITNKGFISFQENNELKDITNTHNLSEFDSNEKSFKEKQQIFEKDPNVMTLRELKQENEEELQSLLNEIETKMINEGKNQDILIRLEAEKKILNQEYQELIKEHSRYLQETQGEIKSFEGKNKEIEENIEKNRVLVKNKKVDREVKENQRSFYEFERKIKQIQEKNEEKSHNLFVNINNLNEELINYDELLAFKLKNYEIRKTELFTKLENLPISKENQKISQENFDLKEKNKELLEKLETTRKNQELKEKKQEFEDLQRRSLVLELTKKGIEKKNQEVLDKKGKIVEDFKKLQYENNELLNENFKINEQIIEFPEGKKEKIGLKDTKSKPEKLKEIEKFNRKKKDLNLKIKELFEMKLEIENQKTPIKSISKREKESLDIEINKINEFLNKQQEIVMKLTNEIKALKSQKQEDLDLLDSLRLGIEKQNLIISSESLD